MRGFFKSALLYDPNGIFKKTGKNTQAARQIRFTPAKGGIREIVNPDLISGLKAYIYEAIEVEKAGLKVNFKKNTELIIPEEFQKNQIKSLP